MKHSELLKKTWVLPLLAVLIVAHGIVLYHISTRMTWAVAIGLLVVVLLKHVGVFAPVYALLRRRFKR